MANWNVYVLKDPRDGRARYVGITGNPKMRLAGHVSSSKSNLYTVNNPKSVWVRSLLDIGIVPVMEVIESGDGDCGNAESRWIQFYRSAAEDLLNVNDFGASINTKPPVIIHARIDDETHAQLCVMAKSERRSVSRMVSIALNEYLDACDAGALGC